MPGYFMAAAALALASTFKHARAHPRHAAVELRRLAGSRRLDIFALAVGCLLAAAFAFFSVKLTYDSWQFNDVSTSNDATPLWIPQISMAVGTVLFLGRPAR